MSPSQLIRRLLPFLAWRERITRDSLRADVLAGLVSAALVLPQGVAFATLAGMPPEYGLYGAMLPAVVGALWGSSWHLVSGPTNATSLMVFATIGTLAAPFTPLYVALVLTLNLQIGLIKLSLGLARLGSLVNFISTTVVVGFTAGAGLLIIAAQLRNFFGIEVPQHTSLLPALTTFFSHIGETDRATLVVGIVTLAASLLGRRFLPRVPFMMTGIVIGSFFAYALAALGAGHVRTIGALPSPVPPLSGPDFSLQTWRDLAPFAFALTLIGLTEAISSARSVALKSGQRINGNQEFIGQGLANIVGSFTSSYPTSGSFNRTGANYAAGARTPLATVFSAFALVALLVVFGPLVAYVPFAAMAAILFLVAWGLIDLHAMRTIARTSRGEVLTMAITLLATVTIRLEVAVLVGVLVSLLVYLKRTTHPRVTRVLPDASSPLRRFAPLREGTQACPQLDILRIEGSLFFGAVEHVRDELEAARRERPATTHLLLDCTGVNFVDAAGGEMLAQEARVLRQAGVKLYLCKVKQNVMGILRRGGYLAAIGQDHIFTSKEDSLRTIYAELAPELCGKCAIRAFTECRERLPDGSLREPPRPDLQLR